jgi:L-amino acid N-acyltransferase YncA
MIAAEISISPATREDVAAITEIYNHAILTTSTADLTPHSVEHRIAWFEQHLQGDLAVLVARQEDRIVGWASLNLYSPKAGYRFTADNSVYVHPDFFGRGIGKLLLGGLILTARAKGLHTIVASIDAANEASIRLHAGLGFEQVAVYKELVFKFDRWIDVIHMQLML